MADSKVLAHVDEAVPGGIVYYALPGATLADFEAAKRAALNQLYDNAALCHG